jgi:hypothetical protein
MMRMMRKFVSLGVSLGLIVALTASLAACSKPKDKGNLLSEPKFKAGKMFSGHAGRGKRGVSSGFGSAPKGKSKRKGSFGL